MKALLLICLVALASAPASAQIVRCQDGVFREASGCLGARQAPPPIKTEAPRPAAPVSRADADDLARIENLRAQCDAARAVAERYKGTVGGFYAAQYAIGNCSQYVRAVQDRQRYEALRAEDPSLAAKELEVQQRQANGAVVGGSEVATNSHSCVSDISCGTGYRCVKPLYRASGTCMREVDSMGLPTLNYRTPHSSSIDINTKRQCEFSTDCPIGFDCDRTYWVCVKR